METGENQTYTCSFLCDRLRLERAKVIGTYGSDFYAGEACVTENAYGKGKAYYLGTQPDEEFLKVFIENVCQEEGVHPTLETEEGIEVTCRENENGKFYFILNHFFILNFLRYNYSLRTLSSFYKRIQLYKSAINIVQCKNT